MPEPWDDVAARLSPLLGRLFEDGTSLHVVLFDASFVIVRANAAFAAAVGRDPTGQPLDAFLSEGSRATLRAHLDEGSSDAVLVHLLSVDGHPCSLRARVASLGEQRAFVGEPPWDQHRALEAQLASANAELSVALRENARQARALEEAHREFRDAHWHLQKISSVLPYCMACRSVKTGESTWEEIESFLVRQSDFLSHGYCASCAAKLLDEEP